MHLVTFPADPGLVITLTFLIFQNCRFLRWWPTLELATAGCPIPVLLTCPAVRPPIRPVARPSVPVLLIIIAIVARLCWFRLPFAPVFDRGVGFEGGSLPLSAVGCVEYIPSRTWDYWRPWAVDQSLQNGSLIRNISMHRYIRYFLGNKYYLLYSDGLKEGPWLMWQQQRADSGSGERGGAGRFTFKFTVNYKDFSN
jgi:hypothetical protein